MTAPLPPTAMRTADIFAAVLVGAILVAYLGTLRDGLNWDDDFAMYLLHAKNILAAQPYGHTGYWPNPWNVPGPATYPPVYPLLLAPVLFLQGFDYWAMKALTVLCLAGSLILIYAVLAKQGNGWHALAVAAVFGLSPYLWSFKDELRSDIPFLLFTYATLLVAARNRERSGSPGWVLRGLALGLMAYLAYGTRSVGIVLLPAVLAADWLEHRRPARATVVATGLFVALFLVQDALLHSDRGYMNTVTLDPGHVVYNLYMYGRSFSILWGGGAGRAALFALVTALALVGYIHTLRRRAGPLEIFPWFYMGVLCLYWAGDHMIQQRYVLPLLPLYLYYALLGLKCTLALQPQRVKTAAAAGLAVLIGAQYAVTYAQMDRGPIRDGLSGTRAAAAFTWLRQHAAPSDVIVAGKARAVTLYTGRPSASAFGYRSDEEIGGFLRAVDARYLVIGRGALASTMDPEHPAELPGFVDRHPQYFHRVLQAGELEVYRIEPVAEFPG